MQLTRRKALKSAGVMGAAGAMSLVTTSLIADAIDKVGEIMSSADLSGSRTIARFRAGTGTQELGLATAPWQMPDGPAALVARRDGSIAILDTLNKRVSVVRSGNVAEVIDIPGLGYALDIEEVGGRLFVLDLTNGQVVTIDGRTITRRPLEGLLAPISRLMPGSAPGRIAVVEADGGAYDFDKGCLSASRNFPDQLGGQTRIDYAAGFLDRHQATVNLPSGARASIFSSGFLGSVVPAGRDDRGRSYVVVSEIDIYAHGTDVDLTIRRYETDGTAVGVARVPVRGRATNPRRAVSFAPNGDAFALFTTTTETLLLQLEWQTVLKPLARVPIAPGALRNVASACTAVPTSRQDAGSQALLYTNTQWSASATNLTARTTDCNGYAITTQVPAYLVGTGAGTKTGLPYCWGGTGTISWFTTGMSNNWMAGNVYCTGYYKCGTYGCDCSGYVQQNWNVTNPKKSVSDLWSAYVCSSGSPASSGSLSTGDCYAYTSTMGHIRMHDLYANWNGSMYLGCYMFEAADPAWDDKITYAYRAWADFSGYSWGAVSFQY